MFYVAKLRLVAEKTVAIGCSSTRSLQFFSLFFQTKKTFYVPWKRSVPPLQCFHHERIKTTICTKPDQRKGSEIQKTTSEKCHIKTETTAE